MWARVFMSDLALSEDLGGELALYDIDRKAAERNAKIGGFINKDPKALSKFDYVVYDDLESALNGADFVAISILPATFKEMRIDVHAPEEYGIYQSVGDTAGPGGVLRAMRTVPLYEQFARAIKKRCPKAWVINFTNPMSICTKTLFDVFPEVKAFGCCHEVFHAQELFAIMLKELKGVNGHRSELYTDSCGVNHFTWITEARYQNIDLMGLLPDFIEKFGEEGYFEQDDSERFQFRWDPFAYGNNVKFDLYKKFGALAAAGDRHLAEFCPAAWYLKDPETVKKWHFNLTTVDYREKQQADRIAETIEMAEGRKPFTLKQSSEEAVGIIKALLGFNKLVTNVNTINRGQMPQLPLGTIVETNCVFTNDMIKPVLANDLPSGAIGMVYKACMNIERCYEGIKKRDLEIVFSSFISQALCEGLELPRAHELFEKMCFGTRQYLEPFFDLKGYFG